MWSDFFQPVKSTTFVACGTANVAPHMGLTGVSPLHFRNEPCPHARVIFLGDVVLSLR